MNNPENRTKEQLLNKIDVLEGKVAELEKFKIECRSANNAGKQVAAALQEREERFSHLVKNSNDIIVIIDKTGKEIYVSDSVEQITGFTSEEVLNFSGFEFLHPDDLGRITKILSKLLKTPGRSVMGEYRHKRKEGGWVYLEAIGTNYLHEPSINGIVLNVRNITERKHAEEKEKHLIAVLKALRNVSQLIVQEKDPKTLIKKVCGNFVENRGFQSAWIALFDEKSKLLHFEGDGLGKSFHLLQNNLSHDNHPHCINKSLRQDEIVLIKNVGEECIDCPVAKMHKGKPMSIMMKSLKYGDTYYGVLNVSLPFEFIDDKEEQSLFNEVAEDIAYTLYNIEAEKRHQKAEKALRASENNLRAIFNVMTDAVFEIDYDGRYINIAPTAVSFVIKPYHEMLNKTLHDIFPKPDADKFLIFFRKCLDENNTATIEYPLTINDEEIWFEGRATPKTGNSVLFIARDITERIATEKALQESGNNLRALFNAMTDVVFEMDYNGRYLYIAPTSPQLMFKPSEDIIGKTMHEVFPKPEADRFLTFVRKCLDENTTITIEYPLTINDKTTWFEGRATPKTKNSVLYIASDITQRKKAEEVILESEEKYRNLFTSANDAIFLMQDYTFISCNPKTLEMYGSAEDEILGHTPLEFSPEYQPDGGLSSEKAMKNMNAALAGNPQFFEWVHLKKDGSPFYAEISLNKIVFSNNEYIHAIVRDISGRKRSEQIQKVLYNISNAVSTTHNLEELIGLIRIKLGTIIDTTNFYVALYDSNTDTLSLPFYTDEKDKFSSVPAGKTLTKYVIETKKPLLADIEIKKRFVSEGKLVHVGSLSKIWLGVPLKIEGQIIGVLAVQSYTDENAYDETDMEMLEFVSDQISISINRKKVEQDLIAALKKAEESDRLKSAFLANMSHEIRTPMNGILSFIDLLSKPKLTGEKLQEYIDVIKKSSDRMLSTVNDLIDISMIESGQMKLFNAETNVNEQIENLYAFFKPDVEKKGMKFSFISTLPTHEAIINTDTGKFNSILTNLINNAIKFTNAGSVEFGYSLKSNSVPAELEFFVKDTGIGIHKDRQQMVFSRFVQADQSLSRPFEGSGLGLSIAKAYVKMLGGKIWVESEEGKGSQFYFTIPYNYKAKVLSTDENEISEGRLMGQLKELTLLIVEDDVVADAYLTIIVKNICKKILHANTGIRAIDIFRTNPDIDLILMDIRMPEMDGYEATRKIREMNKDVVIIAQTAYALASDREKVLEAGCNDYISKPIKKDYLFKLIGKYFGGR